MATPLTGTHIKEKQDAIKEANIESYESKQRSSFNSSNSIKANVGKPVKMQKQSNFSNMDEGGIPKFFSVFCIKNKCNKCLANQAFLELLKCTIFEGKNGDEAITYRKFNTFTTKDGKSMEDKIVEVSSTKGKLVKHLAFFFKTFALEYWHKIWDQKNRRDYCLIWI